MTTFQVGDRVRLKGGFRTWTVIEVGVPDPFPPPPSTYLVRLGKPDPWPEDGEIIRGDRALEFVARKR